MRRIIIPLIVCLSVFSAFAAPSDQAIKMDWPTYRFDVTRSGATAETVGPELFLEWKYVPKHPPKPAWPMPAEEMPRMHCDNAYHVAIGEGNVYFGSCVTNEVYSIDATVGKIRWTFFTEGPVRFAPTFANDRVYAGSDDGYVYCLSAKTGKLIWKYRAGPTGEKVIGNGRIISLWPVRTSVLVDGGTVYFGAGVFPYEGIYICALDADDGSVIWRNDTMGDRVHELDYGGISPHGYLVASKDVLYVPSGRTMPAAFSRKNGEFLFSAFPGDKCGGWGGTWALLDNDRLIAGVDLSEGQGMMDVPHKVAYDATSGEPKGDAFGWFHGIDMVLTRDISSVLTSNGIYRINRAAYSEATKKADQLTNERKKLGKELSEAKKKLEDSDGIASKETNRRIDQITIKISELATEEKRLKDSSFKWLYSGKGLCALIMAGDILFAGSEGLVVAVDGQTGKGLWKGDVSGKAVGLAAADGHLFVSTDKGLIYCFGKKRVPVVKDIKTASNRSPFPTDEAAELYRSAAERIVKEASIDRGYCLVLDCNIGRLAFELAKRTDLQIIGIEKDPGKLEIAREKLGAAGLLGSRIVVESWDVSSLPPYFANLIVSDGMLLSGKLEAGYEQLMDVLRPSGGVVLTGVPTENGDYDWRKSVRGKLQGSGSWTHLYGNPENTANSGDKRVKGPFGLLWFGEPGPQRMVERHARAPGPLSINGRLFIQGEEVIMAYDAYNGTFLWEREIPGAVRVRADVDGGNLALTEDAVYVGAYDECYRLEPATGKTIRIYKLPADNDSGPRRWGYVGCAGNTLFGTATTPLETQYAAIWRDFDSAGRWKNLDEMPSGIRQWFQQRSSYMQRYLDGESRYPTPDENARRGFQRFGGHWRMIDDFPGWGSQHSPQNALTDQLMGGDAVFALDANTGKPLWVHHGKRIPNISVTVADGTVFFVESAPTLGQRQDALEVRQQLIKKGVYEPAAEAELQPDDADVRIAVALDAASGEILWRKPIDLTGCGGDKMGAAYADGLLLFFGHFSNHDALFFKKGELAWRRITALNARTGEVVWSRPLNYLRRPLIVGQQIIIEPRACDLHTGRIIMRNHPITGKQVPWEFLRPGHSCGITSASAEALFYRSYNVGIYELTEDRGFSLFGGLRPGCWLNMITANGLMLMPEASSGCTCSFSLRCSLALVNKPRKATSGWTVFITHGEMTPVQHLAVNFGAPGDMRDSEGTLWFGYPNPKTEYVKNHFPNYGVKFDLNDQVLQGMGYFCKDFRGVTIEGTDKPWLFTSGCRGLIRCELPLIDDSTEQKPGIYTVRIGFSALPEDRPGQRIFDIKLQGQVVLRNFDVLQTTGKTSKAVVKEFKTIRADSILVLELVPKYAEPQIDQAPIINFIEVIKEDHRQ